MSPTASRLVDRCSIRRCARAMGVAAVLLVLATDPGPAGAADYVISSGVEGGAYHGLAQRLAAALREQGHSTEHRSSQGSLENLAALVDPDNPVDVALTQSDALRDFLDRHPGSADAIEVVDDVGRECVVLLTRREDGIASAADLKTKGHGVLDVESPGSGAAVTYAYMSRMDPAFRQTPVVYRNVVEALMQMRTGPGGEKIAAAMIVARPGSLPPALELALRNPSVFRIAPIRPADVEGGRLPDGSPVYSFESVETGLAPESRIEYETLCTRGLLVASIPKLSAKLRALLSRVMLQSGDRIAPGR